MPEKHKTSHEPKHAAKEAQAAPSEPPRPEAPGFKLPNPDGPAPPPAAGAQAPSAAPAELPPAAKADTGARDQALAGAFWLALLVAFFFAKNAYANHLVKNKIAPYSANAAGWWLFMFLSTLAALGALGWVSPGQFLAPVSLAAFAAAAVAALVGFLLTGRR